MRLGAYPCVLTKDTKTADLYTKFSKNIEKKEGKLIVSERHRHRFEFNMKYREAMEKK